jgi:DNA replicative helicase MCM subunit Mcm2 (Cdc46/Mcm family)
VINESLDKVYGNKRKIDPQHFQKYLYISSSISVSITAEAEEVLSLYLAALRNRDVESFNNYDISLKKLIGISEAHAKLCLRNKILVDDAVIRYGCSS